MKSDLNVTTSRGIVIRYTNVEWIVEDDILCVVSNGGGAECYPLSNVDYYKYKSVKNG